MPHTCLSLIWRGIDHSLIYSSRTNCCQNLPWVVGKSSPEPTALGQGLLVPKSSASPVLVYKNPRKVFSTSWSTRTESVGITNSDVTRILLRYWGGLSSHLMVLKAWMLVPQSIVTYSYPTDPENSLFCISLHRDPSFYHHKLQFHWCLTLKGLSSHLYGSAHPLQSHITPFINCYILYFWHWFGLKKSHESIILNSSVSMIKIHNHQYPISHINEFFPMRAAHKNGRGNYYVKCEDINL